MSDLPASVTTLPEVVRNARADAGRQSSAAIGLWAPRSVPVVTVASLRVFAGALIGSRLGWLALTGPAAIAQVGGPPDGMRPALARCAALQGVAHALGVSEQTLWLGLGAGLGAAICVGIWTQVWSALLLFVLWGSRCSVLFLAFQDAVIPVLAFWTMLLPPDGAWRLLGSVSYRSWACGRVDGWVISAYVAYLWVALFALTLVNEGGRPARIWFFIAIAGVIALRASWRALAALPAAMALARLRSIGDVELVCAAAAGVWAILLASSNWPWRGPAGAAPRSTMNVSAAVGVGTVLLLIVRVAAGWAGVLPAAQATSRMLQLAELGFPVDAPRVAELHGRDAPAGAQTRDGKR